MKRTSRKLFWNYNDFIAVHYCVQSMGYCDDCAIFEVLSYCLLYARVGPFGREISAEQQAYMADM
jgi:hypothetical protein